MYKQLFELHSDLLKALGHPRRLEILQLLREERLCVSDIHTMLDLPQANISQHLMVLRDAGVVRTDREGKQVFYQIADQRFVQASDLFRDILIEQHKDTPLADELTMSMKDLVPLTHDPVCHMRLSPKTASFAHQHAGQTYYFCASGCEKMFIQQPERFL